MDQEEFQAIIRNEIDNRGLPKQIQLWSRYSEMFNMWINVLYDPRDNSVISLHEGIAPKRAEPHKEIKYKDLDTKSHQDDVAQIGGKSVPDKFGQSNKSPWTTTKPVTRTITMTIEDGGKCVLTLDPSFASDFAENGLDNNVVYGSGEFTINESEFINSWDDREGKWVDVLEDPKFTDTGKPLTEEEIEEIIDESRSGKLWQVELWRVMMEDGHMEPESLEFHDSTFQFTWNDLTIEAYFSNLNNVRIKVEGELSPKSDESLLERIRHLAHMR